MAFVDPIRSRQARTLGRAFGVTLEQFRHIARWENAGGAVTIDTDMLRAGGTIRNTEWYGTLLALGTLDDSPVVTLTGLPRESNPPTVAYLDVIRAGLGQTYPSMTREEIEEYLRSAVDCSVI